MFTGRPRRAAAGHDVRGGLQGRPRALTVALPDLGARCAGTSGCGRCRTTRAGRAGDRTRAGRAGDDRGPTRPLPPAYLGNAARLLGRDEEAVAELGESLALAEKLGDERAAATARIRLGEAHRCFDRLAEAEACLRIALDGPADVQDFALQHLGKTLLDAGRAAEGQPGARGGARTPPGRRRSRPRRLDRAGPRPRTRARPLGSCGGDHRLDPVRPVRGSSPARSPRDGTIGCFGTLAVGVVAPRRLPRRGRLRHRRLRLDPKPFLLAVGGSIVLLLGLNALSRR